MSLSLKINIIGTNTVKTLRFSPEMTVQEACSHIREKTNEGGDDHGLFEKGIEGKTSSRWLLNNKTLQYYDINNDSILDYKKKHRPQKIKLLDETIKTQLIDESTSVSEIVSGIARKMGIKNPEEYSLIKEGSNEWLNVNQILTEQGILETDILVLKKKFFFNDANIDRNDPVQLHLLYVQCRDAIIEAKYPTQKEESISLAALQCQVAMGDFNPSKHTSGYLNIKEYLPLQWAKTKAIEKDIYREYKKLVSMSEVNAKYRYVQLCRSLKTYGMTSFEVKIRDRKKLIDHILGITRESMILMDSETKEVVKTHPIRHIKRWAAAEKSFTFDFGDHDTEYLILLTPKPEEIAQLISGYIDIIMKSRRDANKANESNEVTVGVEETVAIKKGTAATTSTFNGYRNDGGPNPNMYAPSQQIPITDLKSALRATDLLIGELNSMKNQGPQAQTFSRSFTTLTPQQYKHQLISHSNAIAQAAQCLLNDMLNPPAQGGMAAAQQQIVRRAQVIMAELSTVGSSAKNAVFIPELSSFSDEIISVATRLSESMAKLMSTASTMSSGEMDEVARLLAQQEIHRATALATMMIAVCDNTYVTQSSANLLVECAKGVQAASSLLVDLGNEKCNLIIDEILHTQVESGLKTMTLNSDELLTVSESLATTSCHPESRKQINNLCQSVMQNSTNLLTAFKSGEIPTQDYQLLQAKVQDVMDSLSLISYSLDCVEQEQKITMSANGADVGDAEVVQGMDLSEEFSNVANDLTTSIMLLRNNLNSPDSLMESYKVVASNANRLIGFTKSVASRADSMTQQRLFNSANAVFESVSTLNSQCRQIIKNPDDLSLHSTIIESAGHLQTLSQNMSADAGKIASITALRDYSKEMISFTNALISVSRGSASHLPEQGATSMFKACKDVSDSLAKLMIGIKKVVQDPKSEKTQMELLELAQKQSLPPMTLVATSKRLATKIADPNQKQKLIFTSDSASQAVQRLMKTCESYKKICGHTEIEEALESFSSTISDLETTEIAVQGGFVETIPGQTREGSAELLMVSIKELNNANTELVSEIRENPARLGELVKNATTSASQVALAAKSLISVTTGKVAQKKILAATKQFVIDMEQLIRTSRSVATNPNDPGADLLLDAASQDVSATIASLVGASAHIDCKELDEASNDINNLVVTKLNSVEEAIATTKSTNESYDYFVEELGSTTKALNAASLQVVAMARSRNIKGLGASAKITASTLNSLVNNAATAISLCDNESNKQAILTSTAQLGQQIVTLLDFAKARVANTKDPIYDQNLLTAAKLVEDNTNKVMRSLGAGGSNQLCDEAIDKIIESTRFLDVVVLPDASGTYTNSALEMNNQQSLLSISEASKKLGSITSNLVSCRTNGDLLGNNSMEAANLIVEIIDSAKKVINYTISSSPPDILIPSKNILDSTALITSNVGSNNIPQIINSARTIAGSTSQLLNISKERAAGLDDQDQSKEAMVKTTQQLAVATSNLAKAVKALTSKEAGAQELMSQAVKSLETSATELLLSTSTPSVERGISVSDFERLLSTCRSVSTTTSQVITSASASSVKPKDMALQAVLSDSAISMSNSIKDILKVSSSMMPGVNLCEEAIEVSQRSIGDLSTIALSVAVGSFDSKNNNKESISHLEAQEKMVEITKSIGSGINDLLKASRQSPEAIGITAKSLAFVSAALVSAAKVTIATTADQDAQNNLITESKSLGDSILRLCQASLVASSNPSKETYQMIVTRCMEASEAMNRLVSHVSSGVNLYKDLDESIDRIKKSTISSSVNNAAAKEDNTKSYQEYKEDLTSNTKDLAIALKNIVSTDHSNLVQISTISKDIASNISNIALSVNSILQTTSDQKIRDSIVVNGKQVIQSTGEIVQLLKSITTDSGDGANQSKLNDSFRQASDGITRFLQSIKQGAIGEILSDAAIDSIRKVISDLDAYSLFAAAGQLESNSADASGATMNEANKQLHLKNLQKEIVLNSKLLIVSGSQLVGSSKGTQEHLGAATTKVANTVTQLVKNAKDIASVLNDPVSQQDILSASKALSISSQQLILAGKDAQRFQKDTTAFRSLGKSAEAVAEAVGQFLTSVYTAISDAGKGIRELEKSYVLISSYQDKPETVISNPKANAEQFAQSARDVAKNSIEIVTSYQTSQDDLVKSSQTLASSVQTFIANSKGITAQLKDNEELKSKVQESVKALNTTVLNHIRQVKDQEKSTNTKNISDSSRAVADKIQSIVSLSKSLPGGQNIVDEEEIMEDLEQTAENELIACAKSIEAATANLMAARPKTNGNSNLLDAEGIAATIVDASGAIAKAVAKLVNSAAVAQSKRREIHQGSFYKQDPTWSNGLISAAKSVGGATHRLVEAAMKSAKGKTEEEELIATARAVAASTAQLVSASRAKSGDDAASRSAHAALTAAAKSVAAATSELVSAAKAATALEEQQIEEEQQEFNFTGSKVKELEQQMKILRLEKELETARKQMLNSRKQNYNKK
eukprot:gene10257-12581_t